MKNLPLLGIFVLLCCWSCEKDKIIPTTINGHLRINQDNLASLTAQLAHITRINGNVTIENTNISDLSLLANVKHIQGKLDIRFNDELLSLNGLQQMERLGGLILNYNQQLSSISFLNTIDIRGDLMIYQGEISHIESLDQITELASLTISDLKHIDLLNFLPNLKTLHGDLRLIDNPKLERIVFPRLNSIRGNLEIQLNPLLENIHLTKLNKIDGQLVVTGNRSLIYLNGLSNLQSLAGDLSIKMNNNLKSLDGLNQLIAVDDLNIIITENSSLTHFCGIKNLIVNPGAFNLSCIVEENLENPTVDEILTACP